MNRVFKQTQKSTVGTIVVGIGKEIYVFNLDVGDKKQMNQLAKTVVKYASDAELSFDWVVAAEIMQRVTVLAGSIPYDE